MMDYKLTVEDITQNDACVVWTLPSIIILEDILRFELRLYKDGICDTLDNLNRAAFGPLVFHDLSIDRKAECYSLHGLDAATIYRARV